MPVLLEGMRSSDGSASALGRETDIILFICAVIKNFFEFLE
jgi:hypothetical protein